MKKKYLILLLFFVGILTTYSQNTTVKGKVSDPNGITLPGVNIFVKGTKNGSSTGADGNYTIKAQKGDILEITYIGFETKDVKVTSSSMDIVLVEGLKTLNEIIVLGSTLRATRKELGNAVTSIKGQDLTKARPEGIASAMQGKIAGAQISQNSGDPSGGFSIKLRGTSSILGSSEPLYVIDGVVMNNSTTNMTNLNVAGGTNNIGQNRSADINPNDIESVEVLNGGAAAAIYGSRAANGVILITTKKGKLGSAKYTLSTGLTSNELRKKVYFNTIGKQFVNPISPGLFPINNASPVPTANTVNVLGRNLDTRTFDVTRHDYQDDIFGTGFGNDTYLSVQGGDAKNKYSASIGYLKNEGIVINSDFKRIGAKLRLQHEINDKLTASMGVNYITSSSNEKPDGNVFWSPLNSIIITNNIYDLNNRDANGNLQAVETGRVNPLSVIETFKIKQATDRIIADFQLNYKPFKNFTADFIFGLDNYNQKGNVYIPRYPYAPVNPAYFNDGYVSESANRVNQINNDLNLRHSWEINSNIKLTTAAGYNAQIYRDKFFAIEGRDLKPFVETINAFNTILAGSPKASEGKYNVWGYYLQETVNYKEKLFVTAALRLDASTIFSESNRQQLYPKLSASYVLSNEEFMKNSVISSARIRASWGESGSLTAITPYARFTNYATGNLVGNTTFTLEGDKQGNLDIKPEKSSTYEVGTDLGIFKDRLNLSFSYYKANIVDLLLPVQTAASTGSTNTIQNVGKMSNKGLEIGLKYKAIKSQDLNLDLFFNYSQNRNIVTDLPQTRFVLESGNPAGAPIFAEIGKPIGIYYGTYYARNADGSFLLTPSGYPQGEKGNPATGEAQRDAAGQPTGSFLNKQIGDPNPDYILSFGANLSYRKFDFSFMLDGVQGGDIFDADYRTHQGVGSGELVAKELTGELPRGYIWSIYNIQEFRVVDGSYLKLREISLTYTFGKLNNFFDDFSISAIGRNLYSWDNYTSYDPETNSGGQSSIAKYNFGTIPIPKTFSLAFKFQF